MRLTKERDRLVRDVENLQVYANYMLSRAKTY